MKDNTIVKLDDRTHVLLRPQMYIGSTDKIRSEEFFLKENKFKKTEIEYVPGLIKIINEIIDNAIDEAVRTEFKFANSIRVTVTDTSVTVKDNGRGIPVKKIEGTDHYMPVVAFCETKAGSNFSDVDRETIGMNGIGSTATNIFSKKFVAETSDGTNKLVLSCSDNMGTIDFDVRKNSQQYTKVYFEPDLEKFKLSKIDDIHKAIIKQRLYFLSMSFPAIKFYFNDERTHFGNYSNFVEKFSEKFEILSSKDFFVAVTPNESDDFSFFSYVNGLYLKEGGNHITLITNEIVNRLREKIQRKYKNIKPGDIKNKLHIVVFFNNFKSMRFNSQSKEMLSNSFEQIREYMSVSEEEWDKFVIRKIYKNESIIDPIVEMYRLKEEYKNKQALKNAVDTGSKRVVVDGYLAPTNNKKYLVLSEGLSAMSGISAVLGRKDYGYYPLRGKPLNVYETKIQRIVNNEEIMDILKILEIDVSGKKHSLSYQNVLIATDADLDGSHIRGLLLAVFHRFTPKALSEGRIKVLVTPMIIVKKKDEIIEYFNDFESYNRYAAEHKNGYEFEYKKGLGSWKAKELKSLFDKHGIDKFIESFEETDTTEHHLQEWMSYKTADVRKSYMYDKEVNLYKI